MGKFALSIVLAVAAAASRGWATVYMWKWFVVPLGVAQIGFFQSLGLSVLIALFTASPPKENDKPIDIISILSYSIFISLFLWFIGYIYYCAM